MSRTKTYIQGSCKKSLMESKMFRSSSRQDKILAAFEANMELVQQLDEYIGDEYIELLKPKKKKQSAPKSNQADGNQNESGTNDSEDRTPMRSGGMRSGGSRRPLTEDLRNAESELGDESGAPEQPTSESGSESDAKIENSKKIKSTTIIMHPEYEDAAIEIKGMLNADAKTAGVYRVQKKDDEMWIYYKDSINLNNVMAEVMDKLVAGSYAWLIFNRLARSDNAMVFDVLVDDSLVDITNDSLQK